MYENLESLVAAAKTNGPVKIAVAAGHDPDVIGAMKEASEMGLAEGIFVGNPDKIYSLSEEAGFNIPPKQIITEVDESKAAFKAISLNREGKASLLMKGKINTATLIKAVLDKEFGIRTG